MVTHVQHTVTLRTAMTDVSAALTLQTWMSAAFPTGAFSCSHGMEAAITDGRVSDAQSCTEWISGVMQHGSGWNDALLTSAAYSRVLEHAGKPARITCTNESPTDSLGASLKSVNNLALALCAGSERHRETTQLGQAFAKAAAGTSSRTVLSFIDQDICLPVAVGAQGALSDIPLDRLLPAALQANSSNLVWICTRLIPLGQTEALNIISSLQAMIINTAIKASHSTLNDLGSCALLADIASIEHEQLHSRICIT